MMNKGEHNMNKYAYTLLNMADDGKIRPFDLIRALLNTMSPEKAKDFYEDFLSSKGYLVGQDEDEDE